MDNMRTRFVIAVTGRLASAADTAAKVDLIEELSENLYSRWQDLTAQGFDENEAFDKALEDLGNVDELLAYLDSLGPEGELPRQEGSCRDFTSELLHGVEGIVRETVSQTKDAVDQAAVIVRNVADKIKEKYPDGFKGKVYVQFDGGNENGGQEPVRESREPEEGEAPAGEKEAGWSFSVGYNRNRGGFFCESGRPSRRVEGTSVPSAEMKGVDVQINGDVTINLDDDPEADVVITGEAEELEARLSPRYLEESGRAIAAHLLAMPEYPAAGTVFCFVGFGPEVDTRPILENSLAAGKVLCVPRCTGPGQMELRQIGQRHSHHNKQNGLDHLPGPAAPHKAEQVVNTKGNDSHIQKVGEADEPEVFRHQLKRLQNGFHAHPLLSSPKLSRRRIAVLRHFEYYSLFVWRWQVIQGEFRENSRPVHRQYKGARYIPRPLALFFCRAYQLPDGLRRPFRLIPAVKGGKAETDGAGIQRTRHTVGQRGAVQTRTHGDPPLCHRRPRLFTVQPIHNDGIQPALAAIVPPEHSNAGTPFQHVHHPPGQHLLMTVDTACARPGDKFHSFQQARRTANIVGARLQSIREKIGHLLLRGKAARPAEQHRPGLATAQQQPGALGPIQPFVPRHGDKRRPPALHIHVEHSGRLGCVYNEGHAPLPAQPGNALYRLDKAKHVGHVVADDSVHTRGNLPLKGRIYPF